MLREMSYSSLPQDESSASERSSFMAHGLIELPHRSSSGSNKKIICFVVSFLLVTGATLAIVVPLMIDGPKLSNSEEGDSSGPLSSQLNSGNYLSNLYNKLVGNGDNATSTNASTNSSEPQSQSNYTTHVEAVTLNPNDDKTWKVVNTGDHIYIVPVYNDTITNITQLNITQTNNTQTTLYNDHSTPDEGNFELFNNMTLLSNSSLGNNTVNNGTFVVNGTESSNNSGQGVLNVTSQAVLNVTIAIAPTTQPIVLVTNAVQVEITNSADLTKTDIIALEQPLDHSGSPWEQYSNTSSFSNKTSVVSGLDNMTLVVLVALIVVSLSTLVAAMAFLIHVKIETKRRRQNIANVINDLQSPDKIILLNSDDSENSEESDDEYRRH